MTFNDRYANAKIYELIDYSTGNFYIGSTCLPLYKRFYIHKKASKQHIYANIKLYNTFTYEMFHSSQINIILIEDVTVENKQQLLREENRYIIKHIDNPLCLNTYRSYVSSEERKEEAKQYYNENKDYIKLLGKQYYNKNKDNILQRHHKNYEQNKEEIKIRNHMIYENNCERIKERNIKYWHEHADELNNRRKEKIQCECGQLLSKWNISKHIKSMKHINYSKSLNTEEDIK